MSTVSADRQIATARSVSLLLVAERQEVLAAGDPSAWETRLRGEALDFFRSLGMSDGEASDGLAMLLADGPTPLQALETLVCEQRTIRELGMEASIAEEMQRPDPTPATDVIP